eukprot:1537652-Amphidinium_carterae.1
MKVMFSISASSASCGMINLGTRRRKQTRPQSRAHAHLQRRYKKQFDPVPVAIVQMIYHDYFDFDSHPPVKAHSDTRKSLSHLECDLRKR